MLEFRRATAHDAEQLTQIAHAAKAHWGYPEEWIKLWRDDLTFTAQSIADYDIVVAADNNGLLGFVAIEPGPDYLELEHFWISPEHMSKGIGRQLFAQVLKYCEASSSRQVRVVSDPNASGFYVAMGFQLTGSVKTKIQGRTLPVYHYNLDPHTVSEP